MNRNSVLGYIVGIAMIVLFITFLPQLIGLFFLGVAILYIYRFYKQYQFRKEFEKQNNQKTNQNYTRNSSDDIIDVEYTETEVEDDD